MAETIELGDIIVDVEHKDIKNLHLSVYPPNGKVRIAAPMRMNLDTIRVFAISKLRWIKQQQRKLREQERETPREYIERESHYLWGKRYLLSVIEQEATPDVQIEHNTIVLRVRPGTEETKRQDIIAEWYREVLKQAIPPLIATWEARVGVNVKRFFVQRMKTKWGSCSPGTQTIRLNTELAKKPIECLEYVIVHEIVHLLEPTHNARFIELMDHYMPTWQHHRDTLNNLPVRHEHWKY